MYFSSKRDDSFGQLVGKRYAILQGKQCKNNICSGRALVLHDNTAEKTVFVRKTSLVANQEQVKRLLREVQLLTRLKHDNIVEVTDLVQHPPDHLFTFHVFMPSNLEHFLQNVDRKQFTPQHIKWFTYQIACGIKYIHSANVVHHDLRPSNLLINQQCNLKISSFGSARTANSPFFHADYVEKHYYRSPEVLLGPKANAKSIDIWSIGCIFAEMWRSGPLFRGQNTLDQLEIIFDVLGTPDSAELDCLTTNEAAKKFVRALETTPKQPWKQVLQLGDADDETCISSFLDDLLAYDPSRRATIEQVLNHPYLSEYHDAAQEPIHEGVLEVDLELANWPLTKLQDAIQLEVARFHGQSAPEKVAQENYV